jgi:hypothetical protein
MQFSRRSSHRDCFIECISRRSRFRDALMRFANFANASIPADESEKFPVNDSGNRRRSFGRFHARELACSRPIISIGSRKASEQLKRRSVICFYSDGYHFTGSWATPSNHTTPTKSPIRLSFSALSSPPQCRRSCFPSLSLPLPLSRELFLRLRFLRLFLNLLWCKLLICFVACGSYNETWGKGFFVPSSGSAGCTYHPCFNCGDVERRYLACDIRFPVMYPCYVRNPNQCPLTIFIPWKIFSTACHRLLAAMIVTCDSSIDSRYAKYYPHVFRVTKLLSSNKYSLWE